MKQERKNQYKNIEKLPTSLFKEEQRAVQAQERQKSEQLLKSMKETADSTFDECKKRIVDLMARHHKIGQKRAEEAALQAKTDAEEARLKREREAAAQANARMWKAEINAPPQPGRSLAEDLGPGLKKMGEDFLTKGKLPNVMGAPAIPPPIGTPQRAGAPGVFKPI